MGNNFGRRFTITVGIADYPGLDAGFHPWEEEKRDEFRPPKTGRPLVLKVLTLENKVLYLLANWENGEWMQYHPRRPIAPIGYRVLGWKEM